MKIVASLFALTLVLSLVGCSSFMGGTADPLSAGTAKMLLEKGKTSQQTILETFGGPNMSTGDANGNEMWSASSCTAFPGTSRATHR